MTLPVLRVPPGPAPSGPAPSGPVSSGPGAQHPGASVRGHVAALLGRVAARLARAVGRDASVVGGRVARLVDPHALARAARGRTVVLVTGTNGKTTTTAMITAAMTTPALVTAHRPDRRPAVATNHHGANMPDGVLSALLAAPRARLAVLEVDESYLAEVAAATDPAVLVLLNFSRDQLDRVGEVRHVARRVGDAVAAHPDAVVVALADDVLCVGAAAKAGRPVWVSAPAPWRADGGVCPRCCGAVAHTRTSWCCTRCGLAPPAAQWSVDGDAVRTPEGDRVPLRLGLPGRANRLNAAFALATAAALGTPPAVAAGRLDVLEAVGGRYRTVVRDDVTVRLLLAKNPAGWEQVFDVLDEADPRTVVVAVNDRQADGRDVSWLWDVDFARLARHRVVATGDRAADLSVRLAYAGIDHELGADPSTAALTGRGAVDLVGNYTAFSDADRGLR